MSTTPAIFNIRESISNYEFNKQALDRWIDWYNQDDDEAPRFAEWPGRDFDESIEHYIVRNDIPEYRQRLGLLELVQARVDRAIEHIHQETEHWLPDNLVVKFGAEIIDILEGK